MNPEQQKVIESIADWKFHDGDDTVGPKVARQILEKYSVSKDVVDHVCEIIATASFKGAGVKSEIHTLRKRNILRIKVQPSITFTKSFYFWRVGKS